MINRTFFILAGLSGAMLQTDNTLFSNKEPEAVSKKLSIPGGANQINASSERNPNIILITVDDMGWTDAGCLGSDFYETPNIDQLADKGMKFTQFYSAAAICSPTRASIMTGKYPARLGITDWIRASFQPGGKILPEKNPTGFELNADAERMYYTPVNPLWMELEETTIAEVLKEEGYITAHIGKWHLGPEDYFPDKQGFDINIGGCDFGEPPSYFDPYHRASMPEYDYDSIPGIPGLPPRKTGEYLTDREATEAINFIKKNRDQPFFLNLCHYAVHVPLQARNELIAKYQSKKPGINHNLPVYAAMIESVDSSVGKIVSILEELNLTKTTIVIFTSDNGGLHKNNTTSNSPLREGKGTPYEGGIRIPLIVRWPDKVHEGSVSDEMLSTIDFFPTFCDLLSIDLSRFSDLDGKSFLPVLKGMDVPSVHKELIWHFPHYRVWDNNSPYSIIREGKWKLIKWYSDQPAELYDLSEDISETRNLSDKFPEKTREMEKMLFRKLEEIKAKIPYINENYNVETFNE